MGILNLFMGKSKRKTTACYLANFRFLSKKHIRFNSGERSSVDNTGAWRSIRIKSYDNIIFYVAIYNMNKYTPLLGFKLQMSRVPMTICKETNAEVVMRGCNSNQLGISFANYGLTLYKTNENIKSITLNMFDRDFYIVYENAIINA